MKILECFKYNQHFVAMMNIINKARLNPPNEGHHHHIIPRCWFKMNNLPVDNSKGNIILLTPEDHKLVHKLAFLCAEKEIEPSLKYAYMMTSNIFSKCSLLGENNPFYGHKHSNKTKAKMSKAKKGVSISEERRSHISESLKGKKRKPMAEETKLKISLAFKARKEVIDG